MPPTRSDRLTPVQSRVTFSSATSLPTRWTQVCAGCASARTMELLHAGRGSGGGVTWRSIIIIGLEGNLCLLWCLSEFLDQSKHVLRACYCGHKTNILKLTLWCAVRFPAALSCAIFLDPWLNIDIVLVTTTVGTT